LLKLEVDEVLAKDSLFGRFLPRLTRYEMPLVENWLHPLFILKTRGEGFDLWLIAAMLAQKNVIDVLLG
jgi:hypothetical protein